VEATPNKQFQRSVNSRLRRLSPPAELRRYAAPNAGSMRPAMAAIGHELSDELQNVTP
jgi:hypothetical protein